MKVTYFVSIAATLLFSGTVYSADDASALFSSAGCTMCHQADKSGIGPSIKEIAAKYAGDKNAPEMLEKKVRAGGSGSFPAMPMPMPPTPSSVSDETIKSIVTWMLGH